MNEKAARILCIDIGSYTQDALFYFENMQEQNLPRFVLPSPARLMARALDKAGAEGQPVYIDGVNMGGGFHAAVSRYLERGLPLVMHPEAAFAITDSPERLKERGIQLASNPPAGSRVLHSADYNPDFWHKLLESAGLPKPEITLIAAQDHGFAPGASSRLQRMEMWRKLLRCPQTHGANASKLAECAGKAQYEGAPLGSFMHQVAPEMLSRLTTIQARSQSPVMDSATAALLGVMSISEIAAQSYRQGVLVINAGNSHISAFLVFKERVFGIYEHHTGQIETDEMIRQLKDFRLGWLPTEEVMNGGGHGVALLPLPSEAEGFAPAYVVGPQREIFKGQGKFVAPHGDMMQNGCFGLLHAYKLLTQ